VLSFCGVVMLEWMPRGLTLWFLLSRSGLIVALIVSQHSYSCGEWFDPVLNTQSFSQLSLSKLYLFDVASRSESCLRVWSSHCKTHFHCRSQEKHCYPLDTAVRFNSKCKFIFGCKFTNFFVGTKVSHCRPNHMSNKGLQDLEFPSKTPSLMVDNFDR
jgi:hypothetical protein